MVRNNIDISQFETVLGHKFACAELAVQALTHVSAAAKKCSYERLEFLGDRVLGLVVSEMLYSRYPGADQGELSVRLNAMVNAQVCAQIAEKAGLIPFIRTGADVKSVMGRKGLNIRADIAESVIASLFLDGGISAARTFVAKWWGPLVDKQGLDRGDAKSALQEWAHRNNKPAPQYRIEHREGPDHNPHFAISVSVEGFASALGEGSSKREAERNAAATMLQREGVWEMSIEDGHI